jgi:predicted RNA binding protein YcfA (HicA-like mRNA interferase family)
MSKKQLVLSGKDFIKLLEKMGFAIVRINGSHHRLKHEDGRVTTIPVHKNDDLPKGLMRKIIREDLKLDLEDFEKLVEKI